MKKKKIYSKKKNKKYRIQRKIFFSITILMLFIACLFQVIGNFTFFEFPNPQTTLAENMVSEKLTVLTENMKDVNRYETAQNPEYLVVSKDFLASNMEVSSVLETLEGMKLWHQSVSYKEAELMDFQDINESVETVIVCGDESGNALTRKQLDCLLEKGIHIVYTQMPSAEAIRKNDLGEIFGIYKMNGVLDQKGMRFVDDVFWGGNLELEDIEYALEDVELHSTCKIYAYGLKVVDKEIVERNEQLPPLMWRNTIGDSKIFVVNGKFFEENKGYGLLTAILTNIYDDYLYPIVNASVMIYDSIPYDGVANEEMMMEIYSRDSLQFQTDILVPSIVSICKRLDIIPTFYTSADRTLSQMDYIQRAVLELGGEVMYQEDAQVKAIDISNPEGRIWDEYPDLPVIVTGFEKNDEDMTKLYSIGSTFGIVVHRVDISKIINADSKEMDWVNVSKDYSNYIAYYQEDFGYLERMTAKDASIRYMEYMLMDPVITYKEDRIDVHIENMPSEASFVLRTEKQIDEVENGTFEEIGDQIYLIETKQDNCSILLKKNKDDVYQGTFFKNID